MVRLRDGRVVLIRRIRPSDAERLRAFDDGLSEASHRFRYLSYRPPLTPEQAQSMATVDFERRFALVATARVEGCEVIVADCRLDADSTDEAELAIAIADDHQDLGLGTILIRTMLGIAAEHGLRSVIAQVKYDNDHMMHVLRALGFGRTAWDLGVVTFTVRLAA